jgi:hypothetical protein
MSSKDEGGKLPAARGYNAGGMVAFPRPDEVVVPLRREEFDILREGAPSSEKASRDLYIGIGVTAVVGLVGLLATLDWDNALQSGHRTWIIPSLILLVASAGAFVGAAIYHYRLKKTLTGSPFSRLSERLTHWFDEPRTLDGVIAPVEEAAAERKAVQSKWQNVANVFWLGSDLESALRFLWGPGSKQDILNAMGQASHHASEIGLSDTEPAKLLSSLKSQAQPAAETDYMNKQWRGELARRISEARNGFAELAKKQQPVFRARPNLTFTN